ncbi:hypothetical protein AYJ66_11990 [Dietzia cinnamea]|nr:hypothetical protein AYJ66_11990 [Dietzia cinnamea]
MWLILALSAVLVALIVLRGVVQATAINRFLTEGWPAVGEAAGLAAPSAGWIIDTSFVMATAWVAIAASTFSGSRAGRAIFTALLAGVSVIGLGGALAPQAAALGRGELVLAAAHPTFASLTSAAVVLVGLAVLVLLYLPEVNEYFRVPSTQLAAYLQARTPTHDDAPLTMNAPAPPRAQSGRPATKVTIPQRQRAASPPLRAEPIAFTA